MRVTDPTRHSLIHGGIRVASTCGVIPVLKGNMRENGQPGPSGKTVGDRNNGASGVSWPSLEIHLMGPDIAYRWVDRGMLGWVDGEVDGWMDGGMDGWMDGQMGGWRDGQRYG